MTWRNVFDLGEVDVYYVARSGHRLLPIDEIAQGSIEVVDGVIRVRDVETGFDPDAFVGVAIVPKFSIQGLRARSSVLSIDTEPLAAPQIRYYLRNPEDTFKEVWLAPVKDEELRVIGTDPQTDIDLGEMQGAPGEVEMLFTAVDLGG